MQGLQVQNTKKKVKLFYTSDTSKEILIAESENGIDFSKATKKTIRLPSELAGGKMVPDYKWNNSKVAYFGGDEIKLGVFKTLKRITYTNTGIKGGEKIFVDFVMRTYQGIFLLYHTYNKIKSRDSGIAYDDSLHLIIKVVCFDPINPDEILWETKNSIWPEPELWRGKKADCFGCIYFNGRLISYWNLPDGIFLINFPVFEDHPTHEYHHFKLDKHYKNPILSPTDKNVWENEATFNPAALYEDGKVYLLYRALGHGYLSVLGLAESDDGLSFERVQDEPVYVAREGFETKSPYATPFSINKFKSAGGIAGCEDPKITKIGDRLYMIYVAFNGWSEPRLAITSILYKDFLAKNFLWEKPVLISPPGVIDKSGCVLPEKVRGKYVIFHRVFPDILIDFVDDLNFDGTKWLRGEYKIKPRPTMWDSRKIAAGAPPIKTKDGWLMIYQGVTDNDDSKYKVGAMLLDLSDPTKVLYRSHHPIIEPTEHYENGLAKFGVVYPCGAIIKNDKLMVYYGGSDSVTCVATANLRRFISELKSDTQIKLELPL